MDAKVTAPLETGELPSNERSKTLESPGPQLDVPSLPMGARVGRYVVEEWIGAGGMGVVFGARDPTLDRVVALKCLRPEVVAQHGEGRLLREARGMAQLAHPNVVAVYGVERAYGTVVIAMEHVRGQTLREWLERPRSWTEIVARFVEAGRGLAAAHAAGLVHRDFKPSNVLVGEDGRVRVMDFGLVRLDRRADGSWLDPDTISCLSGEVYADHDARTQTGMVMGTVAYMAPEQLAGQPTDARCDQFAFCLSLWEALCGQRPYGGGLEASRRAKALGPPAWPGSVVVPRGLVELVSRGLAPRPEDRWPSMDVLLHRLERIGASSRRSSGARWMLGTAAVVAGALGMGLWSEPPPAACTGARERVQEVWSAPQAEAVRQGLHAAGAVHLEETWPRVQPRLDAWAEDWVAAHTEACEATTVRAEVEPGELDRRMACLDRARAELGATVQRLTAPSRDVASDAVALVTSLPSPSRCLETLAPDGAPPPSDPAVAAEVEAIRDALSEVGSLTRQGAYDEAFVAVEPLLERARATGHGPIEAIALLRRGRLHEKRGDHAAAEADVLRAYELGLEHEDPLMVHQAASLLAFVVGHRRARVQEGLRWANTALVEAQRTALGDSFEAEARERLAMMLYEQGRYDEAAAEQRRALALLERAVESGDASEVELAQMLDVLGNLVVEQYRHEEAMQLHQRALAIRERVLGPSHPDVAVSLNNLGSVLTQQQRAAEAEPYFRRALDVRERWRGPNDASLVSVLSNLGVTLLEEERPHEAEPYLRRCLAITRAYFGEDHPFVGSTLVNLGVLYQVLGDRVAAREHMRRSLDVFERTQGSEHPSVALALESLGELSLAEGKLDDAAQQSLRALAIREAALGPDHPLVAVSLSIVGMVRLAEGRTDDALEHGHRALAVIGPRRGADPRIAAKAHALVGRALLALGRHEEARRARDQAVHLHPKLAPELTWASEGDARTPPPRSPVP